MSWPLVAWSMKISKYSYTSINPCFRSDNSIILSTKDDSSVFFIGESFFYPLCPLSSIRLREFTFKKIKFDIKQKKTLITVSILKVGDLEVPKFRLSIKLDTSQNL